MVNPVPAQGVILLTPMLLLTECALFNPDVPVPIDAGRIPVADALFKGGSCGSMTGLQSGSPWPMQGQCPSHQGRSASVGPANGDLWFKALVVDNDGGPHPQIGKSIAISADGTIYFGADQLRAIKPTGDFIWSVPSPGYGGIASAPAIGADGTIYVGSWDGYFMAVDAQGTMKWKQKTNSAISSSPAIAGDGTVYVGSDLLYAFTSSGQIRWTYDMHALCEGTNPAIAEDGTVYIISVDGVLHAVNPLDGTSKWKHDTGDKEAWASSPAIGADGTIYFGVGKLYAIRPEQGDEKWDFPIGSTASSPAIANNGTVYVGSNNFEMYAIKADSTLAWEHPYATNGVVWTSAAIDAEGTIYFGSHDGNLYAVRSDGSQKWTYATGSVINTSPVIAQNGTLYVGTEDGHILAIAP